MATKKDDRASRPNDENPEWTDDDLELARPAPEALPQFIGQTATNALMLRGRGRSPKKVRKFD